MRNFTFKKGLVGNDLSAQSSFKSFIVLVVMMIMTTSSAMAQGAKYEVIDGLRYLLETDTKTASLMASAKDKYSGDIVVPEKIKSSDGVEYIVTSLGDNCFSWCSGLTSITIPSSVTSLGDNCFEACGLTLITIPSSVTSFGDKCFSCSGLTSITIPSSVSSLGYGCFKDCTCLTSIIIPSSITSLGDKCFEKCSALETVYFKGKVPEMFSSETHIPTTTNIKVPTEFLQDYKDAFGPEYKYIYAWNPDESGDGDKPVTPCATPSVSYESGELKFACETAGAKYHYTINDKDMASDALSEDGKVSLSAAYNISVYATADGYTASEKAEATLYWINANLETANINLAKTRGIVASAHDGIVSFSGLDNGEVVKFYAADGKLLGSSSAVGGVASCAVSEKMVIAKIGMDAIKVLIK